MKVNFNYPWLMLAIIPALASIVIPFVLFTQKRRAGGRRIAAFVARLLAVILLVSSLSGLSVSKSTDRTSVMIVADLSDSTRPVQDLFEEAVKKAASYSDGKTDIGLMTFGYGSEYELPLTDDFGFTVFQTDPEGAYTDIYTAIIKAASLLPENTNKRIILLTDGKENINSVREAANVLKARNIRVDAIVEETKITSKEIQLSDIDVPDIIYSGEEFTITVTVESNVDCDATLTLTEDGVSESENSIKLTKGTNRFVFRRTAESTGICSYTAEVRTEGDWLAGNNKIYSFINVKGTPKILVIDGSGSESHELVKILSGSVTVETCLPSSAPADIAGLRKYEAVVMMNVSKDDLPDGFDTVLKSYVSQLGRGLLYTGGDQSFILGGWQESDLEEILPVSMTIKDEYELNDVGMMILIDNSGSMGSGTGSALELAKEGAQKAASALTSIDKGGVIAFSDNAVWIAKLTSGSEKQSIINKIETIGPGGGTLLRSSLKEATEALTDSGCAIKSIILLTDGCPADEEEIYRSGITDRMKEAGISVTSIAVGDYVSTGILNYISSKTGGTVNTVSDVNNLPNIIYSEALKTISGAYLNNRTFYPELSYKTEVLSDISSLPELDGYVKTEEKSLANTVLVTDEDDPLLAQWQYGLGKAVAFTSDLNGKWSSKLLASDNGVQLIRNMISYILPATDTDEGGTLSIVREGDRGIMTLTTENAGTGLNTEATVISPSGKESTVELTPSGVSSYSGSFKLEEEGSYVAVVTQTDTDGNTLLSKEGAMAVRYSDEYDLFATDLGYVKELCEATGGSADFDNIADIFEIKISGADSRKDLGTVLMIIAIILIMLDIALRRLGIDYKKLWEKISEKLPKLQKKALAINETPSSVASAVYTVPETPSEKDKAEGKEKTEIFAEEKLNKASKAKKKKPADSVKKTDSAAASVNSISDLLKDVDNSRRRKM